MTTTDTTHSVESLHLARLPSGVIVETPVHRYVGSSSGATVYLQALQHGGEVNGALVLRRLHDRLLGQSLSGTVVAVPVANPLAVDHRRYMVPPRVDAMNTNMNRLWPGDDNGTLLQRIVARLWGVASETDVIVDLHTGGADMVSHTRFTPGDKRGRELAAEFGLDLVVPDGNPDGIASANNGQGKLREVAARADIPSLTPELAHSRAIVEESIEAGVSGLKRVLQSVDVLSGKPSPFDPTVATERSSVTAGVSGLFQASAEVGERVSAGEEVGSIVDPGRFDTRETLRSDTDGLVLSINRGSTVVEGETVASVVQRS